MAEYRHCCRCWDGTKWQSIGTVADVGMELSGRVYA